MEWSSRTSNLTTTLFHSRVVPRVRIPRSTIVKRFPSCVRDVRRAPRNGSHPLVFEHIILATVADWQRGSRMTFMLSTLARSLSHTSLVADDDEREYALSHAHSLRSFVRSFVPLCVAIRTSFPVSRVVSAGAAIRGPAAWVRTLSVVDTSMHLRVCAPLRQPRMTFPVGTANARVRPPVPNLTSL